MSSTTLETGPVLVSDLPPARPLPGVRSLLQARWEASRDRRALQRAFRDAGPAELGDLLAQARRG
jgi:hypothetical protein